MAAVALGFGLALWVFLALCVVGLCSCIAVYYSSGALQYIAMFIFVLTIVSIIVVIRLPPDLLW